MEVSEMRKFLFKISIFIVTISTADFLLGSLFHYLQAEAGGKTGAEYYICEKSRDDIIIMGSSRASYHYVSNIISEKLELSCFNSGKDGNGIIMHYGRWKMLSKRYTPKILIYDVTPSFDIEINDNIRYIERLKPFCRDTSVYHYISSLFPLERIKLLSRMYRYDSKVFEIVNDYKHGEDYLERNGFVGLNDTIRREIIEKPVNDKKDTISTDSTKIYYLEKLINEALNKGTRVYLVVSPFWKGGEYTTNAYSKIQELADKHGIPFINYVGSSFCNVPEYFNDSYHLNKNGAKLFTEDVADIVSSYETQRQDGIFFE